MATCRSCSSPIRWAYTDRDKRIPLDPNPLGPEDSLKGAFTLADDCDGNTFATAALPLDRVLRRPLYRSHFATCPHAGKWRRSR